jgi:16S rRNA (cytidine1402-2'-O)-methyltransferase
MIKRELNYQGPSALLYLVATPIGNMGELSPRAKEIFASMDFLACEDTRNSGQLFASLGLDKPLISCHEHNEEEASSKIVDLLLKGKKVAYVSDAGYPSISDPGERLAKKCLASGIKVAVINGPSASLCALVGSGLDTTHYYFEGFLPAKESERDKELEELAARKETLIFYESPHRIAKTLKAMAKRLGEERRACLCRELTKLHEEYIRGTIGEIAALDPTTLLGEMVIIIEGNNEKPLSYSDKDIQGFLLESLKTKQGKDAVKEVCEKFHLAKNKVYSIYLSIK